LTTPLAQPPRSLFPALAGGGLVSLAPDLIAGLTLVAIAVPEQMATARLGGFAPQIGLIAFIAAAVGFAAFGASRQLSAGSDSTITPIFAGSLALLATTGSPQYAQDAAVLAVMVGVVLALAGVFKLGWVADLLSGPVLTGFLAGIAVHIVISQAPSVLGLPEESGTVYQRLAALWSHAGEISPVAIAVGLSVFAVTVGAEKIDARIPGALVALAAATGATILFGLDHHGLAVLGRLSSDLELPHLPALTAQGLIKLTGLALIIALVVMVQTAATTRAFHPPDEDPDVNRDFIGVGAASLLAGLFGAFPVDASPPRTAAVSASGGRTQWTGLFAAGAVVLLLMFGTDLLARAPAAALAGILLYVAQRIFHVGEFAQLFRRTWAEFALALATMLLIVLLPIQTGVAIGIFLSLAHGVYTTTRAGPILFERAPNSTIWWPASDSRPGQPQPGVVVMGFQAPLSFLNAYEFRRGVIQAVKDDQGAAKLFVLEASGIVEIDFTAASVLAGVIGAARKAGLDFAVARLESVRAQQVFDRFGLTELLGANHIFHSVAEAVAALGPA
jgi:MFS superfamily sulfate permease-like transporter